MKEIVKQLGAVVLSVIIFGLLFAVVRNIKDDDGNTGLFAILSGIEKEEVQVNRTDLDTVQYLLSQKKPEIIYDNSNLSGGEIIAGDTLQLNKIIKATEQTENGTVDLLFPDQIYVEKISDADGNDLAGFQKGDQEIIFPSVGSYVIKVKATYKKGCSTTKNITVLVKH